MYMNISFILAGLAWKAAGADSLEVPEKIHGPFKNQSL
jgi:hypothetical protein